MIAAKFCLVLVLAIVIADSGVFGKPTKKSAKQSNSKSAKATQEDHNAAVAKVMGDMNRLFDSMKNPEAVSKAIGRMQETAKTYMNSAAGQQAMEKLNTAMGKMVSPEVKSRVMQMEAEATDMVNDPETANRAAEMVNKSAADLQSAVQAASST